MFEMREEKAKLIKMDTRIGKRGKDKEPQPELVLTLSMAELNDYLSELNHSLKSSFYKKDEGPDANDIFEGSENDLRKLKFPEITGSIKWKGEIVGAEVEIEYGTGTISLDNATAYGLAFTPQEGGTCIFTFNIKADAVGAAVSKIVDSLLGNEITITIKKPESPQAKLIED